MQLFIQKLILTSMIWRFYFENLESFDLDIYLDKIIISFRVISKSLRTPPNFLWNLLNMPVGLVLKINVPQS